MHRRAPKRPECDVSKKRSHGGAFSPLFAAHTAGSGRDMAYATGSIDTLLRLARRLVVVEDD